MSRLKCDCCGDKFQNDDEFEEHLDHEPGGYVVCTKSGKLLQDGQKEESK